MESKFLLLFATVALACFILPVKSQDEEDCINHTLNDCVLNAGENVVNVWPIPINGNLTAAVLLCQNICEIEDQCNYFTYDTTTEICSLYLFFDLGVRAFKIS